jgi:hypothetical protein
MRFAFPGRRGGRQRNPGGLHRARQRDKVR